MRKTHLLAVLLLSVFASARADDLEYRFSFTATSGPIESFAFSFTVPTFVTEGQSPAFTFFEVTDGTTVWPMDEDTVGDSSFPCFAFGARVPYFFGCGLGDVDFPGSGEIVFHLPGSVGLPTAPGVYALGIESDFITNTGTVEQANGYGQLTITPEPTAVILLLTVLAVAFVARRRIAHRPWVLPRLH